MPSNPEPSADQESGYGLIVQQAEKPPKVLLTFLRLILNYQYGLDILVASKLQDTPPMLVEHGELIRCAFLIQDQELKTRNPVTLLSRRTTIPFFLIMPPPLAEKFAPLGRSSENVFICAWDRIFGQEESSLQRDIDTAFAAHGLGKITIDTENVPYEVLRERIEHRLKYLDTIPTLPEIVQRIARLISDPSSRVKELEETLLDDPAIVHKLLQVSNSVAFAGAGRQGEWTLKETIVRLGFKQVGAIAQQIKLINSLVRPQESRFDLHQFWKHSVGCALIADRLYRDKLIPLSEEIEFDDYWLTALLHDIGRLILGFFFWDYFESVLDRMVHSARVSFRRAETRLGDVVNHEYLGQLLLLNAQAKPEVVEAVGTHHTTGGFPKPLVCLIHLADNLCKGLGLGYVPEEQELYNASVLSALKLTRKDMQKLKDSLGESLIEQIEELTSRCMET